MGAPQLKIKKELNYRRGQATRNCGDCDHFLPKFQEMGIGGVPLGIYPRCFVMGAKNGRAYRINAKAQCDHFDNAKLLARLKQGTKWDL